MNTFSLLNNIWNQNKFDERKSSLISQKYNLSYFLSKLINMRDINEEEVLNYLSPIIEENLPNPFKLKDMKNSVIRTTDAIKNNENFGIIADYDVDGSSSVAILYNFLNSLNIKPMIEIPDRLNDGYGPNDKLLLKMINNNINLLFTLDCGTTSFKVLNNKNYDPLDIIIIDHHISEYKLPNVFSVINPNRYDEQQNYKDLAAVGVTYLFLMALRKHLREINYFKEKNIKEPNLLSYLDLVALGTACDVVKLKKYNRLFVKKGLEIIHKRKNKGISKIIDNSLIRHSPTISDLSYIIGPQLNAASRIKDSSLSSKILISDNIEEIDSISRKLIILNEKRKLIEKNIYDEALKQVDKQNKNNIIILKGENWHTGILGIIASRIVEKFNKPTIIISFTNNIGTGSARSINNIDIGTIILNAKNQGIITSGGGHKMAAGLKLNKNSQSDFENFINESIKNINPELFKKINYFDLELNPEDLNSELLNDIEKLEPFGNGNKEPLFLIKNILINNAKIIKEKHLIVFFKNNYNENFKGICFNSFDNNLGENLLKGKDKNFDIICLIKRDYFQNNIQPQIIIKDAFIQN